MSIDLKALKRIETKIKPFNRFALYGTGRATDLLWPYFEKLGMKDCIAFCVDKDDSPQIGKVFKGYMVKKLRDVVYDVDAVVIGSMRYWREISERVVDYLEECGIDIPVVSIYETDSRNKVRVNDEKDYVEFVHFLEDRKLSWAEDFVDINHISFERKESDPKLIAWYLPQFYQMEVNNIYHGQGFTEWTNSSQGIPLYVGHDQPHIPYDVGYYDLTTSSAMRRQIELARMYGIYGFCFHYYWFSGRKTMEKPIYNFLADKSLDFPFCLSWATENWTSVWDGGNYNVIFEQKLRDGDAKRFIQDIMPFLLDDRYICIDGKPLVSVYSVEMFEKEEIRSLFDEFRKAAIENGFPDLYILIGNYNDFDEDVREYGGDALVEYPPAGMLSKCKKYDVGGYLNPYYEGIIYDYKEYVENRKYLREWNNKKYFRSVSVGFDNSVRKSRWGGAILQGVTPDLYKKWLADCIKEDNGENGKNKIVFLSSWNEWAEGSHLEPDLHHGYAMLKSTLLAVYENRGLNTTYVLDQVDKIVRNGCQAVFRIVCIESMGDIVAAEPIARYLKERYPESSVIWMVRKEFTEIVNYNPYIDRVENVGCLGDVIDSIRKINDNEVVVNCHYNERRCTKTNQYLSNLINPQIDESTYFNYGSLLETFCLVAGLPAINEPPIFHFKNIHRTPFSIKKYCVIHCKSADRNKDWSTKKWRELVNYIITKGYDVVEIGLEQVVHIDNDRYFNCTTNHDIQKIAEIIEGACIFCGVDSGFAHIANCLKIPSLILLGKYKSFDRPMPYTGYFADNESFLLYANNSRVIDLSIDTVKARIAKLLMEVDEV